MNMGMPWAVRARESLEAYKSNKSKNIRQSAPSDMHPVKTGADPPFPLLCQMPLIPYGVNFLSQQNPPLPTLHLFCPWC